MLRKFGTSNYETVTDIDDIGMGRLAKRYTSAVTARRKADLKREFETDITPYVPQLEAARKKLAQQLEQESENISGHLPVTSVYDALQIVKASDNNIGVRALTGHLESMWKKDRTASISANTFLNLKDHYCRNYPKAGMGEVFERIAQKGYMALPISNLIRIASEVRSQEDFDYAMMKHGLDGKQPHQVKARKFVLAVLNGEVQEDRPFRQSSLYKSGREFQFETVDDLHDFVENAGLYEDNSISWDFNNVRKILIVNGSQEDLDDIQRAYDYYYIYAGDGEDLGKEGRKRAQEDEGRGKMKKDFRLSDDWKGVSISHATMKEDDIVDAISSDMSGVVPENHKLWGFIEEFENAEEDSDDRMYILNEDIWDAMDAIAPEGTYFGAHPGDGSDFGFWSYEEEDEEEDEEGKKRAEYLDSDVDLVVDFLLKKCPELEKYVDILTYGWSNMEDHLEWLSNAPVEEILSWAKSVKEDEDKEEEFEKFEKEEF